MSRYKLVNGQRIQLTAQEESQRDAEELAWTNNAFNRALENLRTKRNKLLAETDYLALSDNTLSTDMATYRTNLRNLTDGLTTKADVDAVVFPTKPEA